MIWHTYIVKDYHNKLTSIISYRYTFFCFCFFLVMSTLKSYYLNFQIYHTAVLTVVNILYVTIPVQKFGPFDQLFPVQRRHLKRGVRPFLNYVAELKKSSRIFSHVLGKHPCCCWSAHLPQWRGTAAGPVIACLSSWFFPQFHSLLGQVNSCSSRTKSSGFHRIPSSPNSFLGGSQPTCDVPSRCPVLWMSDLLSQFLQLCKTILCNK